jgi:hypothetical protein
MKAHLQSFPHFCRVFHRRSVENSIFYRFWRFAQKNQKRPERKNVERIRAAIPACTVATLPQDGCISKNYG